MRHSLAKAGMRLTRALLIAAIVVTIFVAYGLVNNAWYHVLAVRGGSMQPTITAGDLIVITRPPQHIEVGQVLTLQVDGAIVTHRVVEVRPDGTFVTRGDANDARDDFSANDVHVVGEYRFSIPLLGALIEPLVSGAWANDVGPATSTATSGSWDAGFRIFVWSGRGIVWEPPSTATPSPITSPDPSPSASASGAATPEPTQEPVAVPEATSTPSATAEVLPSPSAEPTPTPSPSTDAAATATPETTPSPSPETP